MHEVKRRVGDAYRAARAALARRVYERGLADTSEIVELERLGLAAADRVEYVPSSHLLLRRAFRGLRIGPEDVVVDLGAGKGRAVLAIGRRFPARRVVGVELAPELARVAAANVAARRGRLRAREVAIVTGDALDFPIPDDMTYVYLFNPFRGEVFRGVLARIVASIERAPRTVTLVYQHPKEEEAVLATGRFALVRDSRGLRPRARPELRVAVYRSVAPARRDHAASAPMSRE